MIRCRKNFNNFKVDKETFFSSGQKTFLSQLHYYIKSKYNKKNLTDVNIYTCILYIIFILSTS